MLVLRCGGAPATVPWDTKPGVTAVLMLWVDEFERDSGAGERRDEPAQAIEERVDLPWQHGKDDGGHDGQREKEAIRLVVVPVEEDTHL